ncbi:transcription factor bHLH30-like [Diospyros lotus]|uniref:transcription factor bHLH30-like n=1 Tax=Diospyros lotus TaxID=55363 RepID=UPI002251C541|nr:transcription factor bHLH30-like [Diospyros lotus]
MENWSKNSFSFNSNPSNLVSNCWGKLESYSGNFGGFDGDWRGGSASISQSLVLDGEKDELIKAPVRCGKKRGASEEKIMAALKSHSEAERRRRERINAHLTTLRGLVPSVQKMDKATLLAEVISQVKQLKKIAIETSKGLLIPMDNDEVKVESHNMDDGTFSFTASLCCDYRPELVSELQEALHALNLNVVKAEISTLESRVKNVFVFTNAEDGTPKARQLLVDTVHQAFSNILDKVTASAEYSPRTALLNKRGRFSPFDSSSSSS